MHNAKVLVFDSGFGGLSILKELVQQLPNTHYTYLADNAYFPYGNMSESVLIERIIAVMTRAIHVCQPDLIIVACNTATTLCLDKLREQFDTPFVGVVPAIKPAAEDSISKKIGVLATHATIERTYTRQLINDFASQCDTFLKGCTYLVEAAEGIFYGMEPNKEKIKQELSQLWEHDNANHIDTVVLACTHFPILKSLLCSLYPHIDWVDSGQAIARRATYLLNQETKNGCSTTNTLDLYFTQYSEQHDTQMQDNISIFINSDRLDKASIKINYLKER